MLYMDSQGITQTSFCFGGQDLAPLPLLQIQLGIKCEVAWKNLVEMTLESLTDCQFQVLQTEDVAEILDCKVAKAFLKQKCKEEVLCFDKLAVRALLRVVSLKMVNNLMSSWFPVTPNDDVVKDNLKFKKRRHLGVVK